MRHIVLIEGLIILSTIFVGNPGSYVYGLPVVDHALTLDNLDVPTPPVKSHITVPNATISHMTKSDIVLGKDKAVKDAVNADKALKDAVKAADRIAVEDVQLTKESGGGGGSLAVIIVACSVGVVILGGVGVLIGMAVHRVMWLRKQRQHKTTHKLGDHHETSRAGPGQAASGEVKV